MTVRLIAFTLIGLSLVNAYSFVRLYSSTYVTERTDLSKTIRTPSSVPSNFDQSFKAELKNKLTIDLNCANKKSSRLKVRGQWIQLHGRMCNSNKLKLVEITNLNNGFTASVFSLGIQQYQTDLIQLDEGVNKIRVLITPLKGEIEEQTVIIMSNHI